MASHSQCLHPYGGKSGYNRPHGVGIKADLQGKGAVPGLAYVGCAPSAPVCYFLPNLFSLQEQRFKEGGGQKAVFLLPSELSFPLPPALLGPGPSARAWLAAQSRHYMLNEELRDQGKEASLNKRRREPEKEPLNISSPPNCLMSA